MKSQNPTSLKTTKRILQWRPLGFAIMLCVAPQLMASSYSFSGVITNTSPIVILPTTPTPTIVHYDSFAFSVTVSGLYDFLSLAISPANWDNATALYKTGFIPASPLTNLLNVNDNFNTVGRSGFNGVSLTTGTSYVFITGGAGTFGSYTNTITGPGTVTPEPGTYLQMIAGLAILCGVRKRNLVT